MGEGRGGLERGEQNKQGKLNKVQMLFTSLHFCPESADRLASCTLTDQYWAKLSICTILLNMQGK